MTIEHSLIQGLTQVRKQIATAAQAAGRTPESVTLIAVSKQQPATAVRTLAALDQQHFAESYLQEALPKMAALQDLPLTWHFIGQLQSNKTRAVAEHFQWVHTLDRDKLATRLNEQRPVHAPALQVCIQVKLVEEAGKGGVWPEQVPALARHVSSLSRLKLRGLMCIPPPSTDVNLQRARFDRLHKLQEQLHNEGMPVDTLSMGMSGDYAAAITAGATLIRIGTAIFGERN